ncbi:MAG: hypothetical protein JXR70_12320 [Spirochaetales bacterium]|nr:hypothetical protein [Spirochaetales bacterium]
MKKRFLIVMTMMILPLCGLSAIDLFIEDNDLKAEINLDFSQGFYASYEDWNLWILAPEFGLELIGEKGPVKIESALDFSGLFTGEYNEILKKAALYWDINDDIQICLGQFKSPFGFEIQRGQSKRPYSGHSLSSKKMAPGYSRGASFKTKDFLSLLDIEAGLFNGGKISDEDSTLTKLLAAGSLSAGLELSSIAYIMIGYSGFLNSFFLPAYYYQFGQSLCLQVDLNFGSKNDFTFFAEFMEHLDDSLALNHHPLWSHGLFTSLEFRISAFEPFISAEHYKENLMLWSSDDSLKGSAGCNVYLEDDIKIQGQYNLTLTYLDGFLNHEIELNFFYSL